MGVVEHASRRELAGDEVGGGRRCPAIEGVGDVAALTLLDSFHRLTCRGELATDLGGEADDGAMELPSGLGLLGGEGPLLGIALIEGVEQNPLQFGTTGVPQSIEHWARTPWRPGTGRSDRTTTPGDPERRRTLARRGVAQ